MAPFHRSRLFWSGLLVAVALLWGWLAFPQCATQIGCDMGGHRVWVGDRSRTMAAGWVDYGSTIGFPRRLRFTTMDRGVSLSDEEQRLFPPAVRRHEQHYLSVGLREVYVTVSYWLLLLAWLAVWLPGLGWWQRRKRAAFQASVANEPGRAAAVGQRE